MGEEFLGSFQISALAKNFQKMFGIQEDGNKQKSEKAGDTIPHLGSWKKARGVYESNPGAKLEGKFIHTLGLTLTRKEVRLKKKVCPSALVVHHVDDGSDAQKGGVVSGDVVITIGIISTAFLKGSEIVELINHTLSVGEKVRFFFECQDREREPFSLVLGEEHLSERPFDSDLSFKPPPPNLPFMSSWIQQKLQEQSAEKAMVGAKSKVDEREPSSFTNHPGEYV